MAGYFGGYKTILSMQKQMPITIFGDGHWCNKISKSELIFWTFYFGIS